MVCFQDLKTYSLEVVELLRITLVDELIKTTEIKRSLQKQVKYFTVYNIHMCWKK